MKKVKIFRWIILLILFSFVLRATAFLYTANQNANPDYYLYKEWVYKSYSFGLSLVYSVNSPNHITGVNQPPGTLYILRGAYELFLLTARTLTHLFHLSVGSTLWINDDLLIFFFRLPSIVADLFLGFLIYITVKTRAKEKIALVSAAFFLLAPPVLYNSTIWGQMDSVNNLFFYLSIIFLVRRQSFFSILFLALSIFVKLSLLPLFPLYFLFAFFGAFFKRSSLIISIIASLLIIFILCVPFSGNPIWIIGMLEKVSYGLNQSISANAYNFWWLFFRPSLHAATPAAASVFFGMSLNFWAYLIFMLFYLPIIFTTSILIRSKKITPDKIFFLAAVTAFASFIFLPKMHERYLYPVIPLLVTWIGFTNKYRYWIIFSLLLLLHFFNLYIVWNPDLFLFKQFEPLILSANTTWLISLVTFFIFGFFYLKLCAIFKKSFH